MKRGNFIRRDLQLRARINARVLGKQQRILHVTTHRSRARLREYERFPHTAPARDPWPRRAAPCSNACVRCGDPPCSPNPFAARPYAKTTPKSLAAARRARVQMRVEPRARVCRTKLSEMPTRMRVTLATRRARHAQAGTVAHLLHRHILQARSRPHARFNNTARERVALTHMPLDHRRARSRAQHNDDMRKNRLGLPAAIHPQKLNRRIQNNAFGHIHERAAILKKPSPPT